MIPLVSTFSLLITKATPAEPVGLSGSGELYIAKRRVNSSPACKASSVDKWVSCIASIPIWQVRRAFETVAHLEMGPTPIAAQDRPLMLSDATFMLARWPLVVGGLTGPVRLRFISCSFCEGGLLRGAAETLGSGALPNKGLCVSSGASSAGKRSTLPSTEAGETEPEAGEP